MQATPILQKVCASGHFVRHSTYTGALMCNSSRGEKIRVLRPPPGAPLQEYSWGIRIIFAGSRDLGDRESRTFCPFSFLYFTEFLGGLRSPGSKVVVARTAPHTVRTDNTTKVRFS